MRHRAIFILAFLPLTSLACGDDSQSTTGSGGSGGTGGESSSGGAPGSGGSGGNGSGGGGANGTGGSTSTDTGTGGFDPSPYLVDLDLPEASAPPVNVGNLDVTYYEDVAYGSDPLHRFDIFIPKSATPAPLMIHIHGGGFTAGDKAADNNGNIVDVLAQGVAYASLNYRLLETVDKDGVLKPLGDCGRALQFLRYHAAELGLDPARVVVKGGSAGAGTSLWLGTHEDMAVAGGEDPVAKQSTRVLAAAINNTQATYDVVKWETVVFADFGIKLAESVAALGMEQRVASFYGMDSFADIDTPPIQAYRAEVDMLGHLSADDPPLYIHSSVPTSEAPKNQSELLHHAYHGRAVMDQANAVGVPVTAQIEALGIDDSPGKNEYDFLLAQLK